MVHLSNFGVFHQFHTAKCPGHICLTCHQAQQSSPTIKHCFVNIIIRERENLRSRGDQTLGRAQGTLEDVHACMHGCDQSIYLVWCSSHSHSHRFISIVSRVEISWDKFVFTYQLFSFIFFLIFFFFFFGFGGTVSAGGYNHGHAGTNRCSSSDRPNGLPLLLFPWGPSRTSFGTI